MSTRKITKDAEIRELKHKVAELQEYIKSTKQTPLKEEDWVFEFSLLPMRKLVPGEQMYKVQFIVTETEIKKASSARYFLTSLIRDKIMEKLKEEGGKS